MKRLLFTALLWTVALHAQGRIGAVHSTSSAPARSSAPHYSAPAGGYRASPAVQPAAFGRAAASQPVSRSASSAPVVRSFTGVAGHQVVFTGNFNHFHHVRHFRRVRPFFFGGLGSGCFNSLGNPFFCNTGFFNTSSYPVYPYPYDYAAPPPPASAPADDSQSRTLSLEIERLSDEIDQMRDENRRLQNERPRPEPESPADETSKRSGELVEPPHVLVFKDGRQIQADNYAISNNVIWILEDGKVKRIPLSEVDLPATRKANSDSDLNLRH